jgi:hypothetical protein
MQEEIVKKEKNSLTPSQMNRIIEMAWEERTPF